MADFQSRKVFVKYFVNYRQLLITLNANLWRNMARVQPHSIKVSKLFNLRTNPKRINFITFNIKIALSKYRSHRELLQIDYRKWSSIVCTEYYSSIFTIGAKNEWFRHVNEINMKKRQNRTIFFFLSLMHCSEAVS